MTICSRVLRCWRAPPSFPFFSLFPLRSLRRFSRRTTSTVHSASVDRSLTRNQDRNMFASLLFSPYSLFFSFFSPGSGDECGIRGSSMQKRQQILPAPFFLQVCPSFSLSPLLFPLFFFLFPLFSSLSPNRPCIRMDRSGSERIRDSIPVLFGSGQSLVVPPRFLPPSSHPFSLSSVRTGSNAEKAGCFLRMALCCSLFFFPPPLLFPLFSPRFRALVWPGQKIFQ